jgi:hypothetical protein
MLSKGLWQWYINIIITILDVIHCPVKTFWRLDYLRLEVEPLKLGVLYIKLVLGPTEQVVEMVTVHWSASCCEFLNWTFRLSLVNKVDPIPDCIISTDSRRFIRLRFPVWITSKEIGTVILMYSLIILHVWLPVWCRDSEIPSYSGNKQSDVRPIKWRWICSGNSGHWTTEAVMFFLYIRIS